MRGTSMLWGSNFIHDLEKVNGRHKTWSRLQSFITKASWTKSTNFVHEPLKLLFIATKLVPSSPLWVNFTHHVCPWWWIFFRRVKCSSYSCIYHLWFVCDRDFNLISFKTCHFLHLSNILTTSLVQQAHKSLVMKDIFLFITLFPN